MGRSILRQETQIRSSDAYVDNIAASQANYETTPANLEADMGVLRSMGHLLLKNLAGNWYDGLNTPATLDAGSTRGVNDLNTDLHGVERKRLLFRVMLIADVTVPADADATGVLTAASQPANNDTVVIGSQTYTFETAFTDTQDYVLISAVDASGSLDNLIAAITNGAGEGTVYGTGTTANTFATAAAGAGDTIDATALLGGTQGNLTATTTPVAVGGLSWGAATLTGGTGDMVILGAGELPTETTAAVGVVTTEGTIVAYNSDFGNISLVEVAGLNATRPKNLMVIHDENGDPIESGGQTVYALLQSESSSDGHTITDSTATRVQLSFVKENATDDDLIYVPAADIAGKVIHYAYVERSAFDDLPETAFLGDTFVDGGTAADITRQNSYDNQSTAPVEVATNSTLDLNGAGISWDIRDLANASLFKITEGSGGGTSDLTIGTGVDTYQNKAVDVDFDQGITVDETGTSINLGVTSGQIDAAGLIVEATGANALDLNAGANINLDTSGGEITFDDVNHDGSTWTATECKLSETSAEWNTYKTNFGEVSLINAINQAFTAVGVRRRVFSVVTVAAAADADVSGPSDDNNLDTDLGDLSGGTFVDDYDFYVNGQYMRPGANAAANDDVYPGTALANGQLKFEFKLKVGDQLAVVDYV